MLLLSRQLGLLITGQTSHSPSNSASNAVLKTLSEIVELSLGLLRLALLVLFDALLLQVLRADGPTDELFTSTNSLIPRTLRASLVVCGNAISRGSDRPGFDGSVGEISTGLGLGLLAVSSSLRCNVRICNG